MGMAANQIRLMSITARKSDLELRAQQISAAKIRLSAATQQTAMNYSSALNNGGTSQMVTSEVEITKEWLQSHSYVLYNGTQESSSLNDLSQGQIDALLAQGYKAYNATTTEVTSNGTYNLSDAQKVDGLCQLFGEGWNNGVWLANPAVGQNGNQCHLIFDQAQIVQVYGYNAYDGAATTLEAVGKSGFRSAVGSFSIEQIANKLGIQPSGGTTTTQTTYTLVPTTVTEMVTIGGADLQIAESEYTASITALSAQEKILDMELTQIDTEHKAVTTEYDAIKTLIKDNTERSFNVFG